MYQLFPSWALSNMDNLSNISGFFWRMLISWGFLLTTEEDEGREEGAGKVSGTWNWAM